MSAIRHLFMFSSRNVHFAILGLILGASTGYIVAFYQAEAAFVPKTTQVSQNGTPANHPNVTPEQLLEMFKIALQKNPNEPELRSRYGSFLFNLGRFQESVESFQKSLELRPNHTQTMEDLFNAQLEGLKDSKAAAATLNKISQVDPNYSGLPALKSRLEERSRVAK
jgi:tetratricopeptide (TPR) repeat protein